MSSNRKLEELIKYIVGNHDSDTVLTRTKLMKLLFLADRISKSEFGSKISDTDYIKYHYGPYSETVIDTLEELDGEGIAEMMGRTSRGKYYQYVPLHASVTGNLSTEEKRVVDDILETYGDMDTEELVDEVYAMYNLDDVSKYTHLI